MYKSQEEFLASNHPVLNCKPESVWVYSGNLTFSVSYSSNVYLLGCSYSCTIKLEDNIYFNFDSNKTVRELLSQESDYPNTTNFKVIDIMAVNPSDDYIAKWGD